MLEYFILTLVFLVRLIVLVGLWIGKLRHVIYIYIGCDFKRGVPTPHAARRVNKNYCTGSEPRIWTHVGNSEYTLYIIPEHVNEHT